MTGLLVMLALISMPLQALRGNLDLSRARPYEVVREEPYRVPVEGRSARIWLIISDADSLEEFAQTSMQAALDLHREFGTDHTTVFLVPSAEVVGAGPYYARAIYAADSLGTKGLERTGVNPCYRYVWNVKVTPRALTSLELSIAESWHKMRPRFPSKNPLSSLACDPEALTKAVADSLGLEPAQVKLPRLRLQDYPYE